MLFCLPQWDFRSCNISREVANPRGCATLVANHFRNERRWTMKRFICLLSAKIVCVLFFGDLSFAQHQHDMSGGGLSDPVKHAFADPKGGRDG